MKKDKRKCNYCGKWVELWDCVSDGYICYKCQMIFKVKNINGN